MGEEGEDREVGEVSIQVTSGKGNIKKYEFVFSTIFHLFFFCRTLKTNDKKRDLISLYIRNKNNDQRVSGRVWWCVVGRGRGGLEA